LCGDDWPEPTTERRPDLSPGDLAGWIDACATAAAPRIPGVEPGRWWAAILVWFRNTGLRVETVLLARWEWLSGHWLIVPAGAIKGKRRGQWSYVNSWALGAAESVRIEDPKIFSWNWHGHWFHSLVARYAPTGDCRPHALRRTVLTDLDAPLVLAFLDHIEKVRNNSIRSRNARLAAVRSFLRFAALKNPEALAIIQRSLAIPMKRCGRPLVGFLSREEVQAIINAPDPSTWAGHRDQVLLATFYNTGARVSEALGIKVADVTFEGSPSIRLHGKGRKDRTVPIRPATALQIRRWLARIDSAPGKPLFPATKGGPLTRSAITDRLKRATQAATAKCASLGQRRVSPHTFRHTTAMHLLQSGVDITLVALWLGHESPATTHIYVEADLKMKEEALKVVQPPTTKQVRYQPPDRLRRFLYAL
jgi:site-specific recombinase XerD